MRLKNIIALIIIGVLIWQFTGYYNRVDTNTVPWKKAIYTWYTTQIGKVRPEYIKPYSVPRKSDPIPTLFPSKLGPFALIASDNIPIYQQLNTNSRILTWLPISERVTVQSRHGEWVLLGEWSPDASEIKESGPKLLGWVQRRHLATPSHFSRISDWEYRGFTCIRGDYIGNYHVNYKGKFQLDWRSQGQGLVMESTHHGMLYGYQSLIWAKGIKDGPWPKLFVIKGTGKNVRIYNEALYGQFPVTFITE